MKFQIHGFQQSAAHNLSLNDRDLLYLRWYVDFKDSENSRMIFHVVNNIPFYWVRYQAIIEDFPCLQIKNKETIARRFDKMCDAGVLIKHVSKSKKGTFTMFAIGPRYIELIAFDNKVECKISALDKKVECALDKKVDPKYPNTNNPNTNCNSTELRIDEVDMLIFHWNDCMNEKLVISKKDKGPIHGIIKTQGFDRIKTAITQAGREYKNGKIKYSWASIIYKPHNISALCSRYRPTQSNLPESIKLALEGLK